MHERLNALFGEGMPDGRLADSCTFGSRMRAKSHWLTLAHLFLGMMRRRQAAGDTCSCRNISVLQAECWQRHGLGAFGNPQGKAPCQKMLCTPGAPCSHLLNSVEAW